MKFESLREAVLRANVRIVDEGLVMLTWGNASGIDRDAGVVAIKPSGVDVDEMDREDIVLVDLETGRPLEDGAFKPSSDTSTHLHLYRSFPYIGGIVHTHSSCAVSWAQAGRDLPCFGTTHADHFFGAVPVTRRMEPDEIASDYEGNTGAVIVECFRSRGIDPMAVPAVLVDSHGPFAWGRTIEHATENALVLEAVARMALDTLAIHPEAAAISQALLDKHYLRKHGPGAYYGQDDSR